MKWSTFTRFLFNMLTVSAAKGAIPVEQRSLKQKAQEEIGIVETEQPAQKQLTTEGIF